ncbi:MAG: hypothetical protein ACPG1A_11445, partial [Halioglobus sp.]
MFPTVNNWHYRLLQAASSRPHIDAIWVNLPRGIIHMPRPASTLLVIPLFLLSACQGYDYTI